MMIQDCSENCYYGGFTAVSCSWCHLVSCVIRAMASSSGREQFLKQFEQIVEGVKQNKTKVSTKV